MKTTDELSTELRELKQEIRKRINSYSCSFSTIVGDEYSVIHFTDESGTEEKEIRIQAIEAEGANIGIYPQDNGYLPHSEKTIEDVHDLFYILNEIEMHLR